MGTATASLNFVHALTLILGAMVPLVFRRKPKWAIALVASLSLICWVVTASLIDDAITEDLAAIARRAAVGEELSVDELVHDGNGDRLAAMLLSWLIPLFTAVPAAVIVFWLRRNSTLRNSFNSIDHHR